MRGTPDDAARRKTIPTDLAKLTAKPSHPRPAQRMTWAMRRLRHLPPVCRVLLAAMLAIISTINAPAVASAMGLAEGAAGGGHAAHLASLTPGHGSEVFDFAADPVHDHDRQGHDAHHGHKPAATDTSEPPSSLCLDCCLAVTPRVAASAPIPVALGRLAPPAPDAIEPFTPERIDPPPRLHA